MGAGIFRILEMMAITMRWNQVIRSQLVFSYFQNYRGPYLWNGFTNK